MTRLTAGARVQRLLSMVPWIAAADGPTIEEICERFDLTSDQLLRDLDTLQFVGVYPYTPGDLVSVVVEEGRVWLHYADFFARPLRLTPEEALALVTAGRTLLAVPGADPGGPLGRGLAKLATVLHVDPEATQVELGPASAATLDLLGQAVAEHRAVELDYYAYGRDEHTRRVVEPHRVHADQGQWYLSAHCRLADGGRLFRIDRIEAATLLDEHFEPPADHGELGVYQPRPDDPRITLRLAPAATWVVEQYPTESAELLDDGRVEVTLAVSARPWLERLLLRLGPDSEIVDADPTLRGAGAEAARRILARYRGESAEESGPRSGRGGRGG